MQVLHHAGVAAIPFKGALLNLIAYPQLGARESVDLDVLVHPSDVPAALGALLSDGFQPYEPQAVARLACFLRYEIELELRHPVRGIALDLHWRIAPAWFSVPLDLAPYWERQHPIFFEGHSFPALARTDHAQLVILHATRHQWHDAIWVLDLAMLLRDASVQDWEHLLARASQLHIERMVRVGLRLTTCLGWPLPPGPAAFTAIPDTAADTLVADVLHSWTRPEDSEAFSWKTLRWHWKMRERWRDRIALTQRLLFRLTPRDWNLVRLPAPLAWLYIPLRALRLAAVYIPRLWRSKNP